MNKFNVLTLINDLMKTVIFFKKKSISNDNYEKLFKNSGFYPIFIPILKCIFINQEKLGHLLKSCPYTIFSAFIFTSENSVCAFKEVSACIDKDELKQIFNITVYVVGPATFDAVKALGFNKVFGKETGNIELLVDFIISFHTDKNPILFLAGYRRMDKFEKKMISSGIIFKELVVYKMEESTKFKLLFNNVINNQMLNIDWIVFFSPYGSDILMKYTKASIISRFKIAAIGPTTSKHLNDKWNIKTKVIAQHPEASSLLDAIMNYKKKSFKY
ncbi:hypothetical protein PMAC_003311 [Pneumocystis sp. 'macacae']|nr:hypothetical protein PMAC_003311 [Pneumocystis sp. 'macacae']